jgi:5'(3')-deoxyribonucleotidase
MDGVVADFKSRAADLLGVTISDINARMPDEQWSKIRDDDHFYRFLPETKLCNRLMITAQVFCSQLGWKLCMLTAIPHENDMWSVFHDKIEWMRERWPHIPVHFGPYSEDKQLHYRPGDVLIDDRTGNCEEWRARGGVAIQVLGDTEELNNNVIDQLIELYYTQAGADPDFKFDC